MGKPHWMKRFVSVWVMRKGFTLIEVMVATMIISVVIAALLKLFENNAHMFETIQKKSTISMYGTLLLGVKGLGFEKDKMRLDELVKDFKVENELRRALKERRVEIDYQEVMRLDGNDFQDEAEKLATQNGQDIETQNGTGADGFSIEIGRTILKLGDQHTSFMRLKLQ